MHTFPKNKKRLFILETNMRPIALLLALTLLAACGSEDEDTPAAASVTAQAPAPIKCEIDRNSIAGIPLGTTIEQVRQQFPKALIKSLQDNEGIAFTSIQLTPDIQIFAYTDSSQATAADNSPITYLDTASAACKTEQGVHPFMEVAKAEQIYGAVQQIVMSEAEARQTAEFDQQPPELSFRIDDSGAFDLTDNNLPKITTDYQEGAKIHSIAVMNLPAEEVAQ